MNLGEKLFRAVVQSNLWVIVRQGYQVQVVENYCESDNDKQLSLITAVKINEKLAVSEALAGLLSDSEKEIKKVSVEMALKLYKLDNGRYPSMSQGLQAFVKKPTIGKIPRNWRSGGYLEDPSVLELVESYSISDDGFDFTIVMK